MPIFRHIPHRIHSLFLRLLTLFLLFSLTFHDEPSTVPSRILLIIDALSLLLLFSWWTHAFFLRTSVPVALLLDYRRSSFHQSFLCWFSSHSKLLLYRSSSSWLLPSTTSQVAESSWKVLFKFGMSTRFQRPSHLVAPCSSLWVRPVFASSCCFS